MAPEATGSTARLINILLAMVIGGAVVGFVVGTRPMPRPSHGEPGEAVSVTPTDVVPGQSFLQLRLRLHGPNSLVTSDLDRLRTSFPGVYDEVVRTADLTQGALVKRSERRAYDGAPPVVPHVIDEQSADACLACHGEGLGLDGRTASVVPHATSTSCTQCHVSVLPRFGEPLVAVDSSFLGAASPGGGSRAWSGAPPTIPHRVQMREDCASCHGVTGLDGLRTTHPARQNCTQCHLSAFGLPR